jgi:hypothetical protein
LGEMTFSAEQAAVLVVVWAGGGGGIGFTDAAVSGVVAHGGAE